MKDISKTTFLIYLVHIITRKFDTDFEISAIYVINDLVGVSRKINPTAEIWRNQNVKVAILHSLSQIIVT